MAFALLAVAWSVAATTRISASRLEHVDDGLTDVTVMLTVKSFTRTDTEHSDRRQAAKEVKNEIANLVSQNRQALQQMEQVADDAVSPFEKTVSVAEGVVQAKQLLHGLTDPATQKTVVTQPTLVDSSKDKGERSSSSTSSPLMIAVVVCGVFMLCGCACFCWSSRKRRPRKRKRPKPIWHLKEVWTKVDSASAAGSSISHQRLRALFAALDELDQSDDSPPGYITAQDLCDALEEPEIEAELAHMGLYGDEVEALFDLLIEKATESDHPGMVTLADFLNACDKAKKKSND